MKNADICSRRNFQQFQLQKFVVAALAFVSFLSSNQALAERGINVLESPASVRPFPAQGYQLPPGQSGKPEHLFLQNSTVEDFIQLLSLEPEVSDRLLKAQTGIFKCFENLETHKFQDCQLGKKYPRVFAFLSISRDQQAPILDVLRTTEFRPAPPGYGQLVSLSLQKTTELMNTFALHTYNLQVSVQPHESSLNDFFSLDRFSKQSVLEKLRSSSGPVRIEDLLPPKISEIINSKQSLDFNCHQFAMMFLSNQVNLPGNLNEENLLRIYWSSDAKKYFEILKFDESKLKYGDLLRFGGSHTAVYLFNGFVMMKDDTSPALSFRFAKLSDFATGGEASFDYIRYIDPKPTHIYRWKGE